MFIASQHAPDEPPLVLVIEDEPLLRTSLARALSKRVEVIDAGTCADALRLIAAARPALVIADLHLPDGSGLEVLDALEQANLRVPVVFMTAYLGAFREHIPSRNDIEVLEKPVPLERIRAVVSELLRVKPEAEPPFSVADFLQLAGMGHRSVVLRVLRDEEAIGELVLDHGELCYAADRTGDGEPAVRRLLFDLDPRQVRVRYERLEGAPPKTNIQRTWQAILLDAACTHDEDSRDLVEADPDDVVPIDDRASSAHHFEAFYEAGVDALLRKDFEEAFEAFLAASKIVEGDKRVIANLARLRQMGYAPEASS
ncbi:MAG: response regulator [Deltaproteobacteria bacterium]